MAMHVVTPRYTPGSPACVPAETAQQVAQEEIAAFIRITTWARGFDPDLTKLADETGVAGIVYWARSYAKHWQVTDIITGWQQQIRYTDIKQGERLVTVVQRLQGNVQEAGILKDWDDTVLKARR
jgi:hypothetical protein